MKRIEFLQEVTWTSQSAGFLKTKTGKIVGVIPAGEKPSRQLFPELYRGNGIRFTAPRDHESYVVDAGKKTYYPLVKYLNSVASDIERIHG